MSKELLVEAAKQGWYTDRSPMGHWVCHAPGGAWHITLSPSGEANGNGTHNATVRNAIVRMARHGFERRGRGGANQLWTLDIEADVTSVRLGGATQWSDSLLSILEHLEPAIGPVTFANAASRQIGARFCVEAVDASTALTAAEQIFAHAMRQSGIGEAVLRKVELER
ncbi:MAG TPA: hypothetical protein VG015_08400 [Candidatus Dormibacteraeota bacterium]|jgi:hypothetical protein|nr:hypothetical protein [Candidatus Dormibacteraeota bacterium]